MHSRLVRLKKKTLRRDVFRYLIKISVKHEPPPCNARIVLRRGYGIHADTKLISQNDSAFSLASILLGSEFIRRL